MKPEDVLRKGKDDLFSSKTRDRYFCDLGEHDLFLDPDTGIAPDGKAHKEHINFSDIAGLVSLSRTRMLLIYQHASRKKDGIWEKLKLLRSADGLRGCAMFACDSGAVSMVVVLENRKRINKALTDLKSWLGPFAFSRIIERLESN